MKYLRKFRWLLLTMPIIATFIGVYAWLSFVFTGNIHWLIVEHSNRYMSLLCGSVMMMAAFIGLQLDEYNT